MATTLVSPGVQVSVIDQSQYIPAATNSVPYVLLATASNKVSGDGVGVAPGTLKANANKLYLITSQRDLSATFGVPFFYQTTNGTPINGYELNEYGLLAAYSALGVTNQCYVQRVDIDLAALTATLNRPTGAPAANSYWFDTTNTAWGLFSWNQQTGAFTNQVPTFITDTEYVDGDYVPLQSYGSIGNYTVVAVTTANQAFYKRGGATSAQAGTAGNIQNWADLYNTWVPVGSMEWQNSWAAVQGTATPSTLTAGNTFRVNGTTITVQPTPYNNVNGVRDEINAAEIPGVYAATIAGRLSLFIDHDSQSNGTISLTNPTGSIFTDLGITAGTYNAPQYQASPSYTVPQWNTFSTSPAGGAPTGSIWQKTSNVNLGTNVVIKKYNSTLGAFVLQNCPVYSTETSAIYGLDPAGGGINIPVGSTYAHNDIYRNLTATIEILERYTTGATVVTGTTANQTFTFNDTFTIQATAPGTGTNLPAVTATILGTTAADFCAAVSAAGVEYVSATVNSAGNIVFTHATGGDIFLVDGTGTPIETAGFTIAGLNGETNTTTLCRPYYATVSAGATPSVIGVTLSNWVGSPTFTYTASATTPNQDPTNGTLWYYSDPTQVDIMIQSNGAWKGYQNVTSDARGYNLQNTSPNGPIISATAPLAASGQSDGTPLVYGDLWVNTSDLENYPLLYRWQNVNGQDQWVLIDNTNQTGANGILFADARWATNGTTNPISDPLPTIAPNNLITSNYLDLDAPNPGLYPNGMLLWNTRRSGFTVKAFEVDYFNSTTFPDQTLPQQTNAWVTQSGNRADGSPYMGRQAQRKLIVNALKAGIDAATTPREEQFQYNLLACPQYPELAPNLVALNNDRANTGFVIIDTPLRTSPNDIVTWSTNNNGLGLPAADGLLTNDSYAGAFYPSCQATDLSGNTVVTCPSHMMIRTIIRSDAVAYPWLAPAGTRRGLVDNALQLGYINGLTGEFQVLGVSQGLRDTLYTHNVNPITYIPGVGITNFGNKTVQGTASATDRINVARLIAFIRGRLATIGNQYLFEPNDQITRQSIKNAIDSLMIDLVAKRGLYDYLVVCDLSNNTPSRIDQNQLWVDIAIEPVKAVEFIYIPMRIQNTGSIANAAIV